jgi:hypothetical protein
MMVVDVATCEFLFLFLFAFSFFSLVFSSHTTSGGAVLELCLLSWFLASNE